MHQPERTCVGCRRRRPKHELLRVARTPQGVLLDPRARLGGRGAHVCPSADCVERATAANGRAIRRALRCTESVDLTEAMQQLRDAITPNADGDPTKELRT